MKPIKAWAVLLPRRLHSVPSRMPAFNGIMELSYPICRSIDGARRLVTQWKGRGLDCNIVRVEICEVPKKRKETP